MTIVDDRKSTMTSASMTTEPEEQRRPLAFVSGGSSGIGRACAFELVARGYRVVIAARGAARLNETRQALEAVAPGRAFSVVLDVTDVPGCQAVVDAVQAEHGPIELLVTSAGICEPGLFCDQPLEVLLEQLATNYTGTLALVHRVARTMRDRRAGTIVLVSSAMAFLGIHGYAGYAPTKFALHGLAETLFTELHAHGISVSVAFPPDTDTPQYRHELQKKSAAAKVITAGGGLYTADVVAARIISQALRGKFRITHGPVVTFLGMFQSLISPLVLRWQRYVVATTR